eukprot:gene17068-20287_t
MGSATAQVVNYKNMARFTARWAQLCMYRAFAQWRAVSDYSSEQMEQLFERPNVQAILARVKMYALQAAWERWRENYDMNAGIRRRQEERIAEDERSKIENEELKKTIEKLKEETAGGKECSDRTQIECLSAASHKTYGRELILLELYNRGKEVAQQACEEPAEGS